MRPLRRLLSPRRSGREAAGSSRSAGGPAEPSGESEARRDLPKDARSELLVALLLFGAAACAVAFIALFFAWDDTQLLGLALGSALALLAAAAVLAGNRVVPQETLVEERPALEQGREEEECGVEETARAGGEGISRRRLITVGGATAGVALGGALIVPVISLGPEAKRLLDATPWARGRRLVDEQDRAVRAEDVEEGLFLTAFPEASPKAQLGAPLVLVRVPPDQLELPPGREGWAPEGILAFSKICTHAGCAIALYRHPKYEPTSEPPALVCPCHYSTFDVRRGAAVAFGPAARPLPQLPLAVGAGRVLEAAGDFSGRIGPSYLGVRR